MIEELRNLAAAENSVKKIVEAIRQRATQHATYGAYNMVYTYAPGVPAETTQLVEKAIEELGLYTFLCSDKSIGVSWQPSNLSNTLLSRLKVEIGEAGPWAPRVSMVVQSGERIFIKDTTKALEEEGFTVIYRESDGTLTAYRLPE